ncbi:c-type cytochrome [Alcaligenes sp. Me129]|uniref:c-type cytochrome n=1 Tax=Alcaligenes sp. Me129 TaxID=3392635 RepID=UPI003D1BC94E
MSHSVQDLSRALWPELPAGTSLLHGAVVRPPYWSYENGQYLGAELQTVNQQAALQVPGVVACVHMGNFLGVLAVQAEQAQQGAALLDARWATPVAANQATLPANEEVAATLSTPDQSYEWQSAAEHQETAWARACYHDKQLYVWAHTQRPAALLIELQALSGLPSEQIHLQDIAGNQADAYDCAMDAAVMAFGRPQAVQIRASHSADIIRLSVFKGTAEPNDLNAHLRATRWQLNTLSGARPSLAAILCGQPGLPSSGPAVKSDYFSAPTPNYDGAAASSDPDSLAQATIFAQESQFDQDCHSLGLDPLAARLEQVSSPQGRDLLQRVAEQSDWSEPLPAHQGPLRKGRGLAYSHIVEHVPGQAAREQWSAWAVDVSVDTRQGTLSIDKLTIGHDSTELGTPEQATESAPALADRLSRWAQQLLNNGVGKGGEGHSDSPVKETADKPAVQLVKRESAVGQPLAWNQGVELPAAAAIANAIFNASGIRLTSAPFSEQSLTLGYQADKTGSSKKRKAWWGALAAVATGTVLSALPWRPAIAPVGQVDTSIFSELAIERGRLVAIAGDCMVCHTAEGGTPNAGGLGLDTPFGTIYTTNITPDKETGIGSWSYKAFERAMREGIHQDGRHLYPAFPYTAFAKISDEDMQSLYAYLMTQEPVKSEVPETKLPFPMNMRPLVAGWNLLFHRDPNAYVPDPTQTVQWNRGAYLVNSSGHCAACHSPRNMLGAERGGEANFLAGGFADNWEAPALNSLSKAPIPWTEQELYQYLRTGYSPRHGVAAGPMGPVVAGLAELPESDVRAMAHYLSSLNPVESEQEQTHAAQAALLEQNSRSNKEVMLMPGENLFNGACAVCHDPRGGPVLFGARPSLALNSNLHSEHPDNTIQVLMHGITRPAQPALGSMPGFKNSMNDEQMEDLLNYMRARFAPDKPAWTGLKDKIATIREQKGHL